MRSESSQNRRGWGLQCSSVDNREDLDGLAALIELCDLVVSTSNVTVHCGALGKETWVLLPYVANFWWLLDRTDSIWYPTVKLYRQKKFQDWEMFYLRLLQIFRSFFHNLKCGKKFYMEQTRPQF